MPDWLDVLDFLDLHSGLHPFVTGGVGVIAGILSARMMRPNREVIIQGQINEGFARLASAYEEHIKKLNEEIEVLKTRVSVLTRDIETNSQRIVDLTAALFHAGLKPPPERKPASTGRRGTAAGG